MDLRNHVVLFASIMLAACSSSSADSPTGSAGARQGDAGDTSSAATSGAGGASAGAASVLPDSVTIEMLGALIGPGKSDGTEWDGPGKIPDDVVTGLATALGSPEIAPILNFAQGAAYQALSKPDPYGIAQLNWDGSGFDPAQTISLATVDNNRQDTFTPDWPMDASGALPGWATVPFTPDLQIRVDLDDEDLTAPDHIGTVTIDFPDLKKAWESKKSYWILTGDPTKQLLAVQVQVTGKVN